MSSFQLQHVLNDAMAAFIGFTFGNIMACDYIYKRRVYVIERLHFEKQKNFNRYSYRSPEGELPDEYPFAEFITLRDKDILEDRYRKPENEEDRALEM